MSIESVILSKEGYSEIERFCKFLGSIIVKNEADAMKLSVHLIIFLNMNRLIKKLRISMI